jgi:hypothetical protein
MIKGRLSARMNPCPFKTVLPLGLFSGMREKQMQILRFALDWIPTHHDEAVMNGAQLPVGAYRHG